MLPPDPPLSPPSHARPAPRPAPGLTAIEPQWLSEVSVPLCTFSAPLADPPPFYRPAVDRVLAKFVAEPLEDGTLERAKTRLIAEAIYAQDSQAMLARWYGASLATGQTLKDVQDWPARIEAVTAEAVIEAARKWLDRRRAVTGYLLPKDNEAA